MKSRSKWMFLLVSLFLLTLSTRAGNYGKHSPISARPYLQTPQVSVPNFADPFNGTNPFLQGFTQPMTMVVLDKNPKPSGFPSDRPDRIGDFTKGTCTRSDGSVFQAGTTDCWISPGGFQRLDLTMQAGQFGNAGRNIAQGPGFEEWDFSALENFRTTDSKTIQFRGEFFNIFNRANL